MPPSKQLKINGLNFKKALNQSQNMIMLRLAMRDDFRKQLRALTLQDLNDPNKSRPDPNAGEKMFRQLLDTIS